MPLRKWYPTWSAPKIREKLRPQCAPVRCPAVSTAHAVLDRHGWCDGGGDGAPRVRASCCRTSPSRKAFWCADYTRHFLLEGRCYCYPLTITDVANRYLFSCAALNTARQASAFPVFERAFQEFGLPDAMRTDNAVPFS